jgi:hypothetical protein
MDMRFKYFIFNEDDDNIDILNHKFIEILKDIKYNGLKIYENYNKNYDIPVFFDLSHIPKNIISLEIYHKFAIIANIPKHIKYLNLIDAAKFVHIPSTVDYLYMKSSYYQKFPEVLNLIPYGIKTFSFQSRIFETNQEYNLDMLPDSINYLILKSAPETKNIFVINKTFPKLKNIDYHHFINRSDDLYDNFKLEEVDKDLYDYINYHNLKLYIAY